MTLYEHVEEFQALQTLIHEAMTDAEGNVKELDDSTKEAIAALADEWKDGFKAKAERVLKFRANVNADADECLAQAKIFQAEADRLKERAKMHTNKIKGLNFLLMTVMDRLGIQKIELASFLLYIQKNPPSMVVHDESKIPAAYFTEVPATLKLETAKLKKDLVDGVAVEWVQPLPVALGADGKLVTTEEMTVLPGAVIVQDRGIRVK